MHLEFHRRSSVWPSPRFVYHAARDAYVVSEAQTTAGLTVEINMSQGSIAYEIAGDLEPMAQFIDLLLTEGMLNFVVSKVDPEIRTGS